MCEVMRAAETWPGRQLAPAETINTPLTGPGTTDAGYWQVKKVGAA